MRFEDGPKDIYDIINKLIDERFPELEASKFIVLFDNKKRKAGGRYVIGRIKKTNDELKVLSLDDDGIAPDYIMFIDKNVYEVLDDKDKERVIFHELCHTEVNFDSDNQYRIKDHEIQSFYAEIEFNSDDQRWAERVGTIAESVYDPENQDDTGEAYA